MVRRLSVQVESWPLARTFTIARGGKRTAEVVVATIDDDGSRGRGECVPYARYGESVAETASTITRLADAVAAGLGRDELQAVLPAGAARNALDCALWDLEAKLCGRRAWDLAGMAAPLPAVSAETLSLDSPERMAAAAALLADRPLLKIKLGGDAVVERVAAVRASAPAARLIVDANEAWDRSTLARVVGPLAALGVEAIEQPLPAAADGELVGMHPPLALCADESVHTTADLSRLAARYQMINVKLDKAGGLTEAFRLAAEARRFGLQVMVGCMVATSLAMAPATLLTGSAAFTDLDGPLWLARDRQPCLRFDRGRVFPPERQLWG
jgi:L-alanine-DL-glutamate epimerase-like enolase superfamily enzyme